MLLIPFALCAFGAAVYVTGMHDASNTVAVPVRTRALGERSALYLAALFNVLGVVSAFLLLGEYSATWVSAPEGETGLSGILAALLVCSVCPLPQPTRSSARWPGSAGGPDSAHKAARNCTSARFYRTSSRRPSGRCSTCPH